MFLLNGIHFSINELELLPEKLRPSVLSLLCNEKALAFFGRNAYFSNHHAAPFAFDGLKFLTMEH